MGLLDFYDDPRANMAMAAGLLGGGNFGQALSRGMAGASAVTTGEEERRMKKAYQQAQEANLRSEIEARNAAMQKQAALQKMLGGVFGGGPAAPPAGPVAGDAYMPGAPAQPPQQQAAGPQHAGGLAGVSLDQVAQLKAAGGPDLLEAWKSAQPKWEHVNGNFVNTNAGDFKGGFTPGMQVSANGQATMWQPDGKGGLSVGAPNGALDTYAAYQNAGKRAENQNTLAPLDRLNPQTMRPYAGTVDDLIRSTQPASQPMRSWSPGEQGMRQQMATGNGNTAGDYAREIRQTEASLQSPNLDPASRQMLQQHLAATRADAQKASGPGTQSMGQSAMVPPGGFAGFAGPADTTRAVDQAKADVVRDTANQGDAKRYGQMMAGVNRAVELLKEGPTGSGMGAMVDSAASFLGSSTKGADLASQLDTLSGWLTSNVPRMEGPQSDKDVLNYKVMAAAVGDRSKPVRQRMAAANELQMLQEKYAALNGYKNEGAAGGEWAATAATGAAKPKKTPVATGMYGGRKVVKYSDGSTDYAD